MPLCHHGSRYIPAIHTRQISCNTSAARVAITRGEAEAPCLLALLPRLTLWRTSFTEICRWFCWVCWADFHSKQQQSSQLPFRTQQQVPVATGSNQSAARPSRYAHACNVLLLALREIGSTLASSTQSFLGTRLLPQGLHILGRRFYTGIKI